MNRITARQAKFLPYEYACLYAARTSEYRQLGNALIHMPIIGSRLKIFAMRCALPASYFAWTS